MSAGFLDCHFAQRRRLLGAISLAACCLTFGCTDPLPPEHRAAISRLQSLGGRVVFHEGGYRLNLGGSQVANEDLALLADIQNLNYVDLQETAITDEGLDELAKIDTPCTIMLKATRTTPAARDKLSETRPNLKIFD